MFPSKKKELNFFENHPDFLKATIDFGSSLTAGLGCATLLHVPNRMAYLAIVHQRPFLHEDSLKRPFHAFTQTVAQRAIFGSAYYFVQKQTASYLGPQLDNKFETNNSIKHVVTGFVAGTSYAIINHPVSYIKSYTWAHKDFTFKLSFQAILENNGYYGLTRAGSSTLIRDCFYGGSYEVIRHFLRKQWLDLQQQYDLHLNEKLMTFGCNLTAAFVGTIVSAPFNYVRAMNFSTPLHQKPASNMQILSQAYHSSKAKHHTFFGQVRALKQSFGVGPATKQAAFGMAFGQFAFEKVNTLTTNLLLKKETDAISKNHLKLK